MLLRQSVRQTEKLSVTAQAMKIGCPYEASQIFLFRRLLRSTDNVYLHALSITYRCCIRRTNKVKNRLLHLVSTNLGILSLSPLSRNPTNVDNFFVNLVFRKAIKFDVQHKEGSSKQVTTTHRLDVYGLRRLLQTFARFYCCRRLRYWHEFDASTWHHYYHLRYNKKQ